MDLKSLGHKIDARSFPIAWPGHWIGSQWHHSPKTSQTQIKQSVNPSTGGVICEFPVDKNAVEAAITTAVAAKDRIAKIPYEQRVDILRRFRQSMADYQRLLSTAMQIEAGKPGWEARADVDSALRYIDWVVEKNEMIFDALLAPARLGQQTGSFKLLPIGVAAGYLPFSTPLTSFAFYFSASVLAGCPLILVNSTHASLTGMILSLLDQTLSLPQGLLAIVSGNFNVFKHAVIDRRVAAILYTGSNEHCDFIRRESRAIHGRQIVLQSGGKNAVLIHNSGDMETALKCVVYGALKSSGQLCTSTSRVFVHKSMTSVFEERLVGVLQKIHIGPTDQSSDGAGDPFMGPIYSDKAIEKFLRYQTMASREAKRSPLWGKTLESNSKGFFVSPGVHIVEKFDESSSYQSNVLFCPDIAIYEYDTLDGAIDSINATDATMAVSFVGDPKVLEARRDSFHAPNLLSNLPTVEIDATLPLAGRLHSGGYRYHGPGIALYLSYPQVVQIDETAQKTVGTWPWPKI